MLPIIVLSLVWLIEMKMCMYVCLWAKYCCEQLFNAISYFVHNENGIWWGVILSTYKHTNTPTEQHGQHCTMTDICTIHW